MEVYIHVYMRATCLDNIYVLFPPSIPLFPPFFFPFLALSLPPTSRLSPCFPVSHSPFLFLYLSPHLLLFQAWSQCIGVEERALTEEATGQHNGQREREILKSLGLPPIRKAAVVGDTVQVYTLVHVYTCMYTVAVECIRLYKATCTCTCIYTCILIYYT